MGCACLLVLAATAAYAGDDEFTDQRLGDGSGTVTGYYALAVQPSNLYVVYTGGGGSVVLELTHTSSGSGSTYAAPDVSTGTNPDIS